MFQSLGVRTEGALPLRRDALEHWRNELLVHVDAEDTTTPACRLVRGPVQSTAVHTLAPPLHGRHRAVLGGARATLELWSDLLVKGLLHLALDRLRGVGERLLEPSRFRVEAALGGVAHALREAMLVAEELQHLRHEVAHRLHATQRHHTPPRERRT